MENQHRLIAGYRDLSSEEIDLMNEIKSTAAQVGALVGRVEGACPGFDGEARRWAAIAKPDLQKGFMALVRAVARPTTGF